jgi:hypothetical protein
VRRASADPTDTSTKDEASAVDDSVMVTAGSGDGGIRRSRSCPHRVLRVWHALTAVLASSERTAQVAGAGEFGGAKQNRVLVRAGAAMSMVGQRRPSASCRSSSNSACRRLWTHQESPCPSQICVGRGGGEDGQRTARARCGRRTEEPLRRVKRGVSSPPDSMRPRVCGHRCGVPSRWLYEDDGTGTAPITALMPTARAQSSADEAVLGHGQARCSARTLLNIAR